MTPGPLEPSDASTSYNPTPHVIPEGDNATPLEVVGGDCTATEKLIIVMCGLPATGKTHIANRIVRYLSFFLDIPTRIFNVGGYRRKVVGVEGFDKCNADFFDHNDAENVALREQACNAALKDMSEFMVKEGVRVAILDSTNITKKRRRRIREEMKKKVGCKMLMMESICDKENIIEQNIKTVKKNTPDYHGVDPQIALDDFRKRREMYLSVYEPVENSDGPHIKIKNSETFIVHNARGYLSQKVVHFVMNLHTLPRVFYLSRHGQSKYNLLGKIGGDAGLTEAGLEYARRLAVFAKDVVGTRVTSVDETTGQEIRTPCPARLWTSTLRRTKETAQFIEQETMVHTWDNGDEIEWKQFRLKARRNLDELYAGTCDGLTYKEIEEKFPDEFKRRQEDKLSYRYPRGESDKKGI